MAKEPRDPNKAMLREFMCNIAEGPGRDNEPQPCHVWAAIQREEAATGKRSVLRRWCAEHCQAYRFQELLTASNRVIVARTGRRMFK